MTRRTLWPFSLAALLLSVGAPATGQSTLEKRNTWESHGRPIRSLAFAPDGEHLAVGTGRITSGRATGGVKVFRIQDRRLIAVAEGKGPFDDLAFAPDGRFTVAAGFAHVHVFDIKAHRVAMLLDDGEKRFEAAALVGGTHVVAISTGDSLIQAAYVWRLKDYQLVKRIEGRFASVSTSADGKVVALGAVGGGIAVYDAATWEPRRTIDGEGAKSAMTVVALSPDGSRVFGYSEGGGAHLWSTADGSEIAKLEIGRETLHDAAFAPDGHTLATVGNRVRLYGADGEPRAEASAHTGGALCLTWSADGKTLVTGGNIDESVIFWTVE